jgi:mono/diheme cytochrome c family protein
MKNVRQTSALLGGAVALALGMGAQAQEREVTYNGDVAQIINENCVVCHREGGVGPMQFENYDQVRPWAPLISYKVENREMPPYAYDQHVGIQDLEGDWRLADEEIDTIVAWVEQGAPLGDTDIVPPTADLPDANGWTFEPMFGEPHLIVPSMAYDIPANGNDLWSKEFTDPKLTEIAASKQYR